MVDYLQLSKDYLAAAADEKEKGNTEAMGAYAQMALAAAKIVEFPAVSEVPADEQSLTADETPVLEGTFCFGCGFDHPDVYAKCVFLIPG